VRKKIQAKAAAYWRAYEKWKKIGSIQGIDAAGRPSRDQIHAR